MENNLIFSLIYISTVYNIDFLTPLMMMYNIYEVKKLEVDGYKILWYIGMNFKGFLINGGRIHHDNTIVMLENILNLML